MEKEIKQPKLKESKRYLVLPVLLLLLTDFSLPAQPIEIRGDDKIEYNLGISFNQEAIDNKAFLIFKVTYDPKILDISFSQGDFARNLLKIEAEKFMSVDKEGNEGLIMTIMSASKRPKAGHCDVSLKMIDRSSDLEVENGSLDLTINDITIVAIEPMEPWKIMLIAGIIILIIVTTLLTFLCSKKKFPKGIIQILEGGNSIEIPLKGKRKFSLREYLPDFPYEFNMGKKPFGYYQGPVIIKIQGDYDASKSTGEAITSGSVIYSEETVKINYAEKTILVNYNH
ncbi:MAG: hypothetical protein IH594_01120 [Bacteroidales bacterium]|nr:hypothetical protein [Bacteroidales bacterium]